MLKMENYFPYGVTLVVGALIGGLGAYLLGTSSMPTTNDADENYMILGPGTYSCETWTESRATGSYTGDVGMDRISLESWVLGYLTALDRSLLPSDRGVTRNLAEGLDNLMILAAIDNICDANPAIDVTTSVYALATELHEKWLAAHPKN